jgi:nitroreductase
MEFSDLIRTRYSVREYLPNSVGDDTLNRVLEAACLAPTAANRQPFQLIVLHTQGKEKDLQRIYEREWFTRAPLVIFACAVKDQAWTREDGKSYVDVDVAIAMDHLILAATELGLGTCWIGTIDQQAAREILGLPDGVEAVVMTPLGYPADSLPPKERKSLADIVRYERW